MKKTAIILGSANPKGNTAQLVEHIIGMNNSEDIELFDLAQFSITPFDYQHRNRQDDFLPLVKRLVEFDTWIFASPVYWYSMSAQLKIFVDRMSDLLTIEKDLGRQLRGKQGAIVATSASPELPQCFVEVFTLTFNYLGMTFNAQLHCDCSEGFDDKAHDNDIRQFLHSF